MCAAHRPVPTLTARLHTAIWCGRRSVQFFHYFCCCCCCNCLIRCAAVSATICCTGTNQHTFLYRQFFSLTLRAVHCLLSLSLSLVLFHLFISSSGIWESGSNSVRWCTQCSVWICWIVFLQFLLFFFLRHSFFFHLFSLFFKFSALRFFLRSHWILEKIKWRTINVCKDVRFSSVLWVA